MGLAQVTYRWTSVLWLTNELKSTWNEAVVAYIEERPEENVSQDTSLWAEAWSRDLPGTKQTRRSPYREFGICNVKIPFTYAM
jgi:hypothetical protein